MAYKKKTEVGEKDKKAKLEKRNSVARAKQERSGVPSSDTIKFAADAERWAKQRKDAEDVARNHNNIKASRTAGTRKQEQIVPSSDSIKFAADAERWAKQRKTAEDFAKSSYRTLNHERTRPAGAKKQNKVVASSGKFPTLVKEETNGGKKKTNAIKKKK